MRACHYPLPLATALLFAALTGCQGGRKDSPAQPRITAFSAQPAQVGFGETTTLAWTVSGVPDSLLRSDDLSGAAPVEVGDLAQKTVTPVRRQTFSLSLNQDAAAGPAQVTVAVKGLDLVAGHTGGSGNLDGIGNRARFANPQAVAVDAQGTIFVADTYNHAIRRIDPDGLVTTVAGKPGEAGFQDGVGDQARFNAPNGLVLDGNGNLLIADTWNHAIRSLAPDGTVTTLAGAADNPGFQDGPAAQAQFNSPQGLALDAAGNLFVADAGNGVIRRLSPDGLVATVAGIPEASGSQDGPARSATFQYPNGLVLASGGALFVTGYDHLLRRIGADGTVTTVAGLAGEAGSQDGFGAEARFNYPAGLVLAPDGDLVIADAGGDCIRRLDGTGRVLTIAGAGLPSGYADGRGAAARFGFITASAVDAAGNTFVADIGNGVIRRITPAGVCSTVAGRLNSHGFQNGPAAQAEFGYITAMAAAKDGSLYLFDLDGGSPGGPVLRVLSPAGQVSTLAGGGQYGLVDGTGTAAGFMHPCGLALDDAGNLYVADFTAVRKVSLAGEVTTLAGSAEPGQVDGSAGEARFSNLGGLARDAQGNLFMSESTDDTIRMLSPAGVVSTLAGKAGEPSGYDDWAGAGARFSGASGLTVDAQGNLYVADYLNGLIRKVSPAGVVTTVAGQAGKVGFGAGPLPGTLIRPDAVHLTPAGDLLVIQDHSVAQITLPD